MDTDSLKQRAAERAVALVEDGMTLGLGSGSTVFYALQQLGQRVRAGELRDISGVPTSRQTARRAAEFGIPLTTLEAAPRLDLTMDGADEVDPDLNLIKGLGGALLWEKIVATASDRLAIIVDDSKLVAQLGSRAPLPVEVVRFGWQTHLAYLADLGAEPTLRRASAAGGDPYVTDSGHYILDCRFDGIDDPHVLSAQVNSRPGIVENGLFLDLADLVVVATPEGVQQLIRQAFSPHR